VRLPRRIPSLLTGIDRRRDHRAPGVKRAWRRKRMRKRIAQVRKGWRNWRNDKRERIRRPRRIVESIISHWTLIRRRVAVTANSPINLQRASQRWRQEFPGT
jgi:hypothetical protein